MALTQLKTSGIADDAVTTDKLANAINTERTANTAKSTNATHTGEVTGSGALTITDDTVDEANLKISNAGSNGQFLQKQSGNTGGLTWADATSTTINNNADNRVITGSGTANTLEGESSLTYDGSDLNISNDVPQLILTDTNSNNSYGRVRGNGGNLILSADHGGATADSVILAEIDGSEKVRIDSSGKVGIGTSSPSKFLHLQTTTAKTNEIEHMLQLTHLSSGTTTTGFGTGIRFQGERNNGALQTIGDINLEADVNSGTNISCAMVFKPATNGTVTERMRIDSSGNVGIGKTPYRKLDIDTSHYVVTSSGQATTGIHLDGAAGNAGEYGGGISFGCGNAGSSAIAARQGGSDPDVVGLAFFTHGSATGTDDAVERMRLEAGGNLVWTGGSTQYVTFNNAGDVVTIQTAGTSAANHGMVYFKDGAGTYCGQITSHGTNHTTSYNTNSDYRLKQNEASISDGITRLKQLKPYRFEWKSSGNKVDGFFAHEAQAVVPESVIGTKDEVDSDNNPIYQGIDQSKLVPLLTAALKEAIAKIEVLETKVAALEAA